MLMIAAFEREMLGFVSNLKVDNASALCHTKRNSMVFDFPCRSAQYGVCFLLYVPSVQLLTDSTEGARRINS